MLGECYTTEPVLSSGDKDCVIVEMERFGMPPELTSKRPPEEQIPTAELPKPEVTPEPEVEKLTTEEIEITTADTQPLPAELRHVVEKAARSQAEQKRAEVASKGKVDEGMRESKGMETSSEVPEEYEGAGEVLLDLGEFGSGQSGADDNFVLDIDLDEVPEPSPAEPAFPTAAFRSRDKFKSIAKAEPSYMGSNWSLLTPPAQKPAATTDQLAPTQEFQRVTDEPVNEPASPGAHLGGSAEQGNTSAPAAEQYSRASSASPTEFSSQQLSPEMIDAIARRAVEQLSEKVVQEIAWEVVPQLAELLIRRQLEEKNS